MAKQIILKSFNEIKIKIGKSSNIEPTLIKPLANKIIHSNPIYTCKIKQKMAVIKFYKSTEIMQKEKFCNIYLNGKGLLTPKIIHSEGSGRPYIIMEMIFGVYPTTKDIKERVRSLAKIHVESLNRGDLLLKRFLPKITKKDRIKSLKKYTSLLKSNNLIEKIYFDNISILKKSILKTNSDDWDNCFCFSDFFVNNSIKSKKGVYYLDFEKAIISNPFIDVGCIVINCPQDYKKIKAEYIKNIIANLKPGKANKFKNQISDISLLIDQGICEKVVEDSSFLSDNSIKKTKDFNFCRRLAKKRIESISFVFDNLKNNLVGEK